MISLEKRMAVLALHQKGRAKKEIARLIGIDVKTVNAIIAQGLYKAREERADKIVIDEKLFRQVYQKVKGYTPRMHEILKEEHGIDIAYSTLTQKLREIGLSKKSRARCYQVPDTPGLEMQHDCSTYKLKIDGKTTKLVCSCLYLRYSKFFYIKFYRSFDRFAMKCFFDEALRFWGYCAKECIIDNTHLAVWYGSGSQAVFVPEMVSFAMKYGFIWLAHRINHPNRKSGVEGIFRTIFSNFIPGREFSSLESLNKQAFGWATEKFAQRPKAKTGLIPIQTFEAEKAYLQKLPEYVPYPCREHVRVLDQYGYAAFNANYYWVPEKIADTDERVKRVKILEYAAHIVIYHFPRMLELVRYDLPADGVRNLRKAPEGVNLRYKPRNRKRGCLAEEKKLRALGGDIGKYLDFILSAGCKLTHKQHFVRRLYVLSRKMTDTLFLKTVTRALEHHVYSINAIARIASKLLGDVQTPPGIAGPIQINDEYMKRESYLDGCFCDERGLENLDLFEDDDDDDDPDAPTFA